MKNLTFKVINILNNQIKQALKKATIECIVESIQNDDELPILGVAGMDVNLLLAVHCSFTVEFMYCNHTGELEITGEVERAMNLLENINSAYECKFGKDLTDDGAFDLVAFNNYFSECLALRNQTS